jgi:protein-arginine kinase activator protein McsA
MSYYKSRCPECSEDIPEDAEDGTACRECGQTFRLDLQGVILRVHGDFTKQLHDIALTAHEKLNKAVAAAVEIINNAEDKHEELRSVSHAGRKKR